MWRDSKSFRLRSCSGVFRRVPVFLWISGRICLLNCLFTARLVRVVRQGLHSDLGVEHQPPETWASGQANYAWRPRLQKQEIP